MGSFFTGTYGSTFRSAMEKFKISFQILLFFLHLYCTCGAIISLECMDKFEEYHKCRNRIEDDFSNAFRNMKEEDFKDQLDVYERTFCRFLTNYTDCSDHIRGCTRYDELAILKDDDVARFNMTRGPHAPNWTPEKCPPARDYQRRDYQGYSGYARECNEAIRELRLCRNRAKENYWEKFYEYPDVENQANIRKTLTCNYHTSVLSSCTASVPSSCFDEESWMTLKFGILINKASIDRMFRSGVDECPAVKEIFDAFEDSKKENVKAGVQIYTTTNEGLQGLENRDMILASKIKTIAKDDLENMPVILEATKNELIFELKKKALALNSKVIVDLKLDIHSVFEGIFNVVLYGTLR